jgi:hypothetical protein
MKRPYSILLALAFATTAGAVGIAVAQPAAAPTATGPAAPHAAGWRGGAAPGARGGRAARLAAAVRHDPGMAVILNLRAIERVYRHDGRAKDLPAFYREQLARTQDPLVRNFVNYRLARLELREDDARGALDALTRNLEENYRRL